MKSNRMKSGVERAPHRSLLKGMGYTARELSLPVIGVINSKMNPYPVISI